MPPDLKPAPAAILELLATPASNGAGTGIAPTIERVPPGGMHAYLTDLAVRQARAGQRDADIIEMALVGAYERKRVPGATYSGGARDTRRLAEWAATSEIAEREHARDSSRFTRKATPAPADDRFAVTWSDDRTPKLLLPDTPEHDDPIGLCAWVTSVLRLDPEHPAIGAQHQGLRGQDGHVVIHRAGTKGIRFEPAAALDTARRLRPMLRWQLLPTDGEPYGFRDQDAAQLADVLRLLCGACDSADETQETGGIIGTLMHSATPVTGHTTYGTSPQRYEAATALRRDIDEQTGRAYGPAHYLIDQNTGELVIGVSDLQDAARRHVGSSLARGWLDARMTGIGWERIRLDGHEAPGRAGRAGPHVRADAYRGILAPATDESVTT